MKPRRLVFGVLVSLLFLWFSCIPIYAQTGQGVSVSISSPDNRAIFQQVNGTADIPVSASVVGAPSGAGVLFILDAGTPQEQSGSVNTAPYVFTFKSAGLAEHTLDAYLIDSLGARIGPHDSRFRIGVGDIIVCMGDSIAEGEVDDISTDNWSADGRNGPFLDPSGAQYGGFEPILNDLLTQAKGYPHSVVNLAHYGDKTTDGIAKLYGFLAQYPTAKTWLVAYGANDAASGMSATQYKSNVQQIVSKIQTAIPGAAVYLPHLFYQTFSIYPAYHDRLGDLIRNNDNVYWGADLYYLFKANHQLYNHLTGQPGTWLATTVTHHPNGIGCQVMAKLWEMALDKKAFLVTNGVLSSIGALWADKITVNGVDKIGLNELNNWLMICERNYHNPLPPGTTSGPIWAAGLLLTNASDFGGGSLSASLRVETDNLPLIGASSWNQVWLSNNTNLLPTTRSVDSLSQYNYDLSGIVSQPGQVIPVADVTAPLSTISVTPASPDMGNGSYSTPPTITIAGKDDTGWPVKVYFHWDTGVDQVYSSPISAAVGTHTLYYYSVDQSGNRETAKSQIFMVGIDPPAIAIQSPTTRSIFQQVNGSANLAVSASVSNIPTGGGVEFLLDSGSARQMDIMDYAAPYSCVFQNVSVGEHVIDAYIVNSTGSRLSAHDQRTQIGVGDILVAVGDDSVAGEYDDISSDNWSADGRNGPYTNPVTKVQYGGFEPILNDQLTAARGYPQSVVNAGADGEKTAGGVTRVSQVLTQNPTARTWLIGYGVNDLATGVSAGTYKANVQSIVNQILAAIPDAQVYISKVLYSGYSTEQAYDDNLGDIVRNTDNVRWGADIQTTFAGNHTLNSRRSGQNGTWFSNNPIHHANGLGFQTIAKLWRLAILQRAYLVSDGVMPTAGGLWADKIKLSSVNKIGLNANNLLLVCEQDDFAPPAPPGTSFAGGWCVNLNLTGASGFGGGSLSASLRVEDYNLPSVGAVSWNQMWLARDSVLMPTTRVVDPKSKYNYDLTASITSPGQLAPVGDVTPPQIAYSALPATPDGINGYYNTQPVISLSGIDSSGWAVKSIRYKWDTGSEVVYSAPFLAPRGVHVLYYYAVDQSGNASTLLNATFKVN